MGEAMSSIASSELPLWAVIFEQEWNERDKLDHWLAEIRMDLHRIWMALLVNAPQELKDLRTEDMYLKFVVPEDEGKPKAVPRDVQKEMENSKAKWFAATGYTAVQKGGKVPTKTPPKKK